MLAELSGLGKAWIGLILMASVTSLPELMVGISSVSIVEEPDLAVGDILGACALNLGILSLMDLFIPKNKTLFGTISKNHILAAVFSLILLSIAGLGLFLSGDIALTPSIGLTSIAFAVVYFFSMRTIYAYQKEHPADSNNPESKKQNLTMRQAGLRYALFALVIIITALALPYFAEHIAEMTGLGKSFVGALFLAISTCLPEVAVSVSAVRMGAADLAVGNILGSNIFNLFILFICDLFYVKGHLLKDASEVHMVSVFFVIIMTAVAIIGLLFPAKSKKLLMSLDTMIIFILYIVNMVLLYFLQ